MKFKTDIYNEIEIPKNMLNRFRVWCSEEEKCSKECKKCELFQDRFEDFMIEYIEEKDGKLIPKEDAEFLVSYYTGMVPFGGGYPVERRITFEGEGEKYTVIAFGWTSELDEKRPLQIVAYAERK